MTAEAAKRDVVVRDATPEDVPEIAGIFGRAFDDYRLGFGVSPEVLAQFWQPSLAARVPNTRVAVGQDGRVAGFIVFVRPGETERYGDRGTFRRRMKLLWGALGPAAIWRPPALFIPMGFAYARRHARPDELYVSLVGVDPMRQGQGVAQSLLAGAESEARACGARAILLHTASNNERARRAYARAGYELVSTVRAPWKGPAQIPAYVALRKPLGTDPTPRLDDLQ